MNQTMLCVETTSLRQDQKLMDDPVFCELYKMSMCCCVVCPVSELSVPVPWGEIRGRVWGPDHGRPVLCLHGWADNCGTFNTLIPLLPKGN